MALVPVLDLRPPPPEGFTHAPSNIEAEQALLGAEMIAPRGSADALALGISPRRFSDLLGLD